jgi:hypothetical protein
VFTVFGGTGGNHTTRWYTPDALPRATPRPAEQSEHTRRKLVTLGVMLVALTSITRDSCKAEFWMRLTWAPRGAVPCVNSFQRDWGLFGKRTRVTRSPVWSRGAPPKTVNTRDVSDGTGAAFSRSEGGSLYSVVTETKGK